MILSEDGLYPTNASVTPDVDSHAMVPPAEDVLPRIPDSDGEDEDGPQTDASTAMGALIGPSVISPPLVDVADDSSTALVPDAVHAHRPRQPSGRLRHSMRMHMHHLR